MLRYALTLLVTAGLAVGTVHEASAQAREWTDRGYININGGFQSSTVDLNDTADIRRYGEDGRLVVNGGADSGALFDISGGARVWRNVSVGLGFHRGTSSSSASVQGSVPHPVFFSQPRNFSAEVGGLTHTESAVHLQFGYMLPLSDKLDVQFFVGPSFFKLTQDVVADVTIAEQGAPFTSVVVQPERATRKASATGVNVGADVTYMLLQRDGLKIGAGFFARYAGASASIRVIANDVSVDLGGFQAGIGARIRF
ncbi:MAG: outer membrane beta-barrel protein [Vicinamibacterales bacterium]